MTTSRTDFNQSWLTEMPKRNNIGDMYPIISQNVKELLSSGIHPKKLSKDLFKIELESTIYYWYGTETHIVLAIEFSKKPQNLLVNVVGKDPNYSGHPPYASNLYNAVLKDTHYPVCIISDDQLSDEGFAIWKRLFNQGHYVSVYDIHSPGQSRVTFKNADEMNQYFGNEVSFKNYRFVLSESLPAKLGEMIAFFNTRRMRELSGLDTED